MLILAATSYSQHSRIATRKNVDHVDYCNLFKNSDAFNNKEILIKATYSFGLEHAELYCLACIDKKTFVEFDESFRPNAKVKKLLEPSRRYGVGRTINITAIGIFYNQGQSGHFGMYSYRFVIKRIVSAELVANSDLAPHALKKRQREKLCQN